MSEVLTSAKRNVQLFVETLVAEGLKKVIISPGSRNAPLTIAFDEHPDLECFLIHDERSAGFVAMGMAAQDKNPVALLCTSGSAVLNYFPAVSEAFYQTIPLIVISADRPAEWINHGDGQTIMQENVFGKHVLDYCALSDDEAFPANQFIKSIQKSFHKANGKWKGPVHFNFAMNEPLYDTVVRLPIDILAFSSEETEDVQLTDEQALLWQKAKRKLVLVGQMPKNPHLQHQLEVLSLDPSVLVMVENTANLTNQRFLHCIDRTIEGLSNKDIDFEPDFLLQIGGAIVSKKIKNLLRAWKIKSHWRVSYDFPEMDTFRKLSANLAVSPSTLIKQLVKLGGKGDELFQSKWKQRDFMHQEAAKNCLTTIPFSDLKAFDTVLDFVPDFSHLHLANSSVVRYAQLFDPIQSINYHSNRGTSGIDGSLSTAVGASIATRDAMHVCITGDISFLYDSNALWNKYLRNNLRVIVINNGGGGIFNIIPGPSSTKQKNEFFFAENESVDLKKLSESFGLSYSKVQSVVELEEELTHFFDYLESEPPKLMEIDTRRCANDELLKKYFKNLV